MKPETAAKIIKKLNKASLSEKLEDLIVVGDVPYRLNRQAVKAIDLQEDIEEGKVILQNMLNGLDLWITELERFAKASDKIDKEISEALLSG